MFVLGDSHALALCQAAREKNLPLYGGMLEGGRNLNLNFYNFNEGDFSFKNPKADQCYRVFLKMAGASHIKDIRMPIICLFGMNIHYLSRSEVWSPFSINAERSEGQFLTTSVTTDIACDMIADALGFYRHLVEMGHTVYSSLPPRRTPTVDTKSIPNIFIALEDILLREIEKIGVRVIDHRGWSLDSMGNLRDKYKHPDPHDDVHANAEFGFMLLQQIYNRHQIEAACMQQRI